MLEAEVRDEATQYGTSRKGRFPIIELFGPTIQGEGALAGVRSHFVRFGGCPYRCKWCDSMHAVDPKQVKANAAWETPEHIRERLDTLRPSEWVTLSGGDPVMWDLDPLVHLLNTDGKYAVAVETEGAMWRPWLKYCRIVTLSPKGPSSGMLDKLDHDVLGNYAQVASHGNLAFIVMKIVVFDLEDLMFARGMFGRYPMFKPFLSVGTPLNIPHNSTKFEICRRMQWLFDEALKYDDLVDVTITPQLHVLAWGHQKGV